MTCGVVQVCQPDIMDAVWHHCHPAWRGRYCGEYIDPAEHTFFEVKRKTNLHCFINCNGGAVLKILREERALQSRSREEGNKEACVVMCAGDHPRRGHHNDQGLPGNDLQLPAQLDWQRGRHPRCLHGLLWSARHPLPQIHQLPAPLDWLHWHSSPGHSSSGVVDVHSERKDSDVLWVRGL